ncbi:MAG: Hsp20/alpha crystallin family protein [Myxococcales bacterium]|nr:Hsp20/alpha crystallin family protein [Myxococcales bacterium]
MAKDEKLEKRSDRPTLAPRVDVFENDREILLLADLPGVSREALTIQADGDVLSLDARRTGAPAGALVAAEYKPVDFKRTFAIPPAVDRERIEAKLEAGVLWLHLPKRAALTPRKVPVRVA